MDYYLYYTAVAAGAIGGAYTTILIDWIRQSGFRGWSCRTRWADEDENMVSVALSETAPEKSHHTDQESTPEEAPTKRLRSKIKNEIKKIEDEIKKEEPRWYEKPSKYGYFDTAHKLPEEVTVTDPKILREQPEEVTDPKIIRECRGCCHPGKPSRDPANNKLNSPYKGSSGGYAILG